MRSLSVFLALVANVAQFSLRRADKGVDIGILRVWRSALYIYRNVLRIRGNCAAIPKQPPILRRYQKWRRGI